MKIEKRIGSVWINGLPIPLVPILMYGTGKLGGVIYNHLEFIWWIYIPLACIAYFLIQFKVSFRK